MSCFGSCANKFETTLKEQIEKMLPMIEERVKKIVEEQLKELNKVVVEDNKNEIEVAKVVVDV